MTKIKEMAEKDRPLERMKEVGAINLSDEELLSIIIKTGTKDESAKDIARKILSKIKNINNLETIKFEELKKIKGIGNVKASTIMAALELAKRINVKENIFEIKITTPEIIFNQYNVYFSNLKQEEFHCLYLDNSKKLIKKEMLFKGTINKSIVHPREIFKEAYLCNASGIICIHNHPSGNVIPSKDDIETTKRIKELGEQFDVKLIDHLIIGGGKYYSFLENMDIL